MREALLPAAIRRQLDVLLNEIATGDLYDLQERYVLLFDRTRSLSLHLFEHVHGESRDRGQAMIDLKALYENGGLEIDATELPDFVPLFLEFLSTRPRAEAYDLLGAAGAYLGGAGGAAAQAPIRLQAVFRALVRSRRRSPRPTSSSALLAEPDPDADDLAALDAAWEDEPVHFGPNADELQGHPDRENPRRPPACAGRRAGAAPPRHAALVRTAPCARHSITSCSAGIPISA